MSNLFSYETAWLKGRNGSTGDYKFNCTVDLNSQSVETNSSEITVKITLKANSNGGRLWTANAASNQPHGVFGGDVEQVGNGIVKYDKSTTPITILVKTLTVPHNADGTKSLSIEFGWVAGALVYYPATQTFTTASITLPTIARASTIVGENALITDLSGSLHFTITSAGNFYHQLKISFNGTPETIPIVSYITTTYSSSILYTTLLEWLGNAVSASLKFTLYTYSDSAMTNLVGKKTATYTVVNAIVVSAGESTPGVFPKLFSAKATEFATNGITTLTDVLSCVVTEERNGPFELEMVVSASTPYFDQIEIGKLIVVKPNHTQSPQAFEIYEIGRPINKKVTIKACHISYRANYIPILPFEATGIANAIIGLNENSTETNPFIIASDIDNTTSTYKQKEPQSLRMRLGGSSGSLLDTFGGEYLWDNFNIVLMTSRGTDNGVQLRVGKNIIDLRQTLNFDRVITGVLPYWKSLEDDVVVCGDTQYSESADNYAYARTALVDFSTDFESEPSASDLNQKAESYVNQSKYSIPSNNIKVKFVDLADTEEYKESPLERVNLCDIVTVVYEDLGISYKAKVVKLKYDPIADRTIEAEIGDAKSSLSETIQGLVDTSDGAAASGMASKLFAYPQSRPTSANGHQSFDATLFHYLSTGSMTSGKPAGNGHIIELQWDNTANLGAELYLRATGADHSSLGIRGSGSSDWNEWAYADLRREIWTGTLLGANSQAIDMSAYSRVRVYAQLYGRSVVFDVDLTTPSTITGADGAFTIDDVYRASGTSAYYSGSRVETHYAMVGIDQNKSILYFRRAGFAYGSSNNQRDNNADYFIYRVEGIL